MRIAMVTAGAAGMYCGSCLRDNALVIALRKLGHDALLIPTYTPVTLDEPDQSTGPVLMGGVNVYLQEKSALFRRTPRWLDWLFDRRWLLKFAGRFAGSTNYRDLGSLTISMLQGEHGHQKKELAKLVDVFRQEIKPEAIVLTNVLLSGIVPTLKRTLGVPIVAMLQGDDIFLDELTAADRTAAIARIRTNAAAIDRFIATSHFYADHMATYLGIDRGRIDVIPVGIDVAGHAPAATANARPVVGYFARFAPEKGFHHFVDAFIELRKTTDAVLKAGGWRGGKNQPFLNDQLRKLDAAGLRSDVEIVPSPDRAGKVILLQAMDLFSVPSVYREPKGLFAMEAWANGVPVVLPDHGCFPELIADTGGGVLVPPGDPIALATAFRDLLADPDRRRRLGEAGHRAVLDRYTSSTMATRTAALLERLAR
jgi:glycosyltransferase involved in cell wall biosynthesis